MFRQVFAENHQRVILIVGGDGVTTSVATRQTKFQKKCTINVAIVPLWHVSGCGGTS